jgi:hypothetical protein
MSMYEWSGSGSGSGSDGLPWSVSKWIGGERKRKGGPPLSLWTSLFETEGAGRAFRHSQVILIGNSILEREMPPSFSPSFAHSSMYRCMYVYRKIMRSQIPSSTPPAPSS